MEKTKKNNGILVGILIGLIIAIIIVGGLFATGNINFKSITINDNEKANDNNENVENSNTNNSNEKKVINQQTFEDIVNNELYILFGVNSLQDLSNERKLTLAFNLVDDEYTHADNDGNSIVESVSKRKVEEIFNNTSISKLGISHQKFDVYGMNDEYYYRENNILMSKRNLFHCSFAKKVENYEEKNNQYIISVKYIFPDTCEGWENFYGTYSYDKQNESNFIVKAHDDSMEYIEPQKYLEDNYDNIKDKLDTYVYVFEVDNNDKINLVDFSIK